jgi:hypothetical protein
MKIIIAVLVPILLGIVVGSNFKSVMTVVIFNQPTIALPIGIWLSIAIGLGLLSSVAIQLAIFVDRRLLKRQIRQLQTRLQQSDEDIFTYTSSVPEADSSLPDKPATSDTKKSLFNSYRSKSVVAEVAPRVDRSTRKPSAKPIIDDEDDWEVEPISNRQLEWEDSTSSRQQNFQTPKNSSEIKREQIYSERLNPKIERESEQTRREVYDADFRLIQPPYKEPAEIEFDDDRDLADFEYTEIDEAEDFNLSSSVKPPTNSRSTASKNSDDDDWGFDFDDRDSSVRAN